MYFSSLRRTMSLLVCSAVCCGFATAAPPTAINIHGQLIGAGGTALTGMRAYSVAFFDAEIGGSAIGTVINGMVMVSADGLLNITVTPPPGILTAAEVWYALGVDTDDPVDNDASDDFFPDRIRVYSVPFALQAEEVVGVDADRVGAGNVDNTEFDALDGVASNIQTQIDAIDTSGIATNASNISQNTNDIALKANSADVYTQSEVDTQQGAQDTVIALKANSADVYAQGAADTKFVDVAGDSMSGPLAVDTLNEATADAGVTADGVTLKDSFVAFPQITAPGDTTDKLYNVAGSLFFNGAQVDAALFDKDALNNSGTLGFDWADDEVDDALSIAGGMVDNDSFSALSDLGAESAIGTGSVQVAAGNHGHNLQDLSGAATDAQVPDALTIQGGSVDNDSFSALSDLGVESAIGTGSGQVAAGNHGHNLQDLGGAVTDAQVPNDITITEADTLASVTGRGATTATQLTLSGGVRANTISEVTSTNGVAVDGVTLKDSFVQLAQIGAPSPTTNRLYNTGGNLFWNGAQLNGGGGSAEEIIKGANISNYIGVAYPYPVNFNYSQAIRHNQSDGTRSAPFPILSSAKVIQEIRYRLNNYEAFPGAQKLGIQYTIRKINTGVVEHNVTGVIDLTTLPTDTWSTLTIAGSVADRTIETDEFLVFYTSTISGTDGGTGEYRYTEEVVVQ